MLFLFLNIVIPYDDMDKQSILIISLNIYIYIYSFYVFAVLSNHSNNNWYQGLISHATISTPLTKQVSYVWHLNVSD